LAKALGDTIEEKGTKKKIVVVLPIHVYMKMEEVEIKKMDKE